MGHFFQLIYEFERILGIENIRKKFGINLHSIAPAIIEIAEETNSSQKQEIKQLLRKMTKNLLKASTMYKYISNGYVVEI